jgi:integrase
MMARARTTEYVPVARQVTGDVVHEAVIFLRDPVWYYRVTLDGGRTYHKGSTKSRDRNEAVEIARQKFYEFRTADRLGIKPSRETVASLIDKFMSRQERDLEAGLASPSMTKAYRVKARILKKHLGSLLPHQITSAIWNDYVTTRLLTGEPKHQKIAQQLGEKRRLTRSALVPERQLLRAVLRMAVEMKLMPSVEEMRLPKLDEQSKRKVSRPSLTEEQVYTLYLYLIMQCENSTSYHRWTNKMFLCYFMLSYFSGARTNDFKLLRWKDCATIKRKDGTEVLVLSLRGKGIPHQTVTQPEAVLWLEEVRRISPHTAPNDFVFTAPRSNRAWDFAVPMRKLLAKHGLRVDEFGRTRSCYSLRHAHAMGRIMQPGVNLKLLADNLGTSPEMLMRHYLSHINVLNHVDVLTADARGLGEHTFMFDPRLEAVSSMLDAAK